MTPSDLRELLDGFCGAVARERVAAQGDILRVIPSPAVDARHADLFRVEARDAGAVHLSSLPTVDVWYRFVDAGVERRRLAAPRGDLSRALIAAAAPGKENRSPGRCDVLQAVESLQAAGPGAGDWWPPAARGVTLARRLAGRGTILDRPARVGSTGDLDGIEGGFPAGGTADVWRELVDAGGFLRRGDGCVRRQTGRRPAAIGVRVPDEVILLDPEQAGLSMYRRFLETAGEALALAHVPARVPAEGRRLPADPGALTYGHLLGRRLMQTAWYEARQFSGTAARLASLASRSFHAERLRRLVVATVASQPAPDWSEELVARGWDPDHARVLAEVCGAPPAALILEATHQAAMLDEYLMTRFGRRWDEQRRAMEILRDLWQVGWAKPAWELLSWAGVEDPDGETVEQDIRDGRASGARLLGA
ncbi:MAG: hypothetical protein ACE5IK_06070 [Acidobacteriota bacterium]